MYTLIAGFCLLSVAFSSVQCKCYDFMGISTCSNDVDDDGDYSFEWLCVNTFSRLQTIQAIYAKISNTAIMDMVHSNIKTKRLTEALFDGSLSHLYELILEDFQNKGIPVETLYEPDVDILKLNKALRNNHEEIMEYVETFLLKHPNIEDNERDSLEQFLDYIRERKTVYKLIPDLSALPFVRTVLTMAT